MRESKSFFCVDQGIVTPLICFGPEETLMLSTQMWQKFYYSKPADVVIFSIYDMFVHARFCTEKSFWLGLSVNSYCKKVSHVNFVYIIFALDFGTFLVEYLNCASPVPELILIFHSIFAYVPIRCLMLLLLCKFKFVNLLIVVCYLSQITY